MDQQPVGTWVDTEVLQPMEAIGLPLMAFLPKMLIAIVFFLVGCVLAKIGESLATRLFRMLGLDKLADQIQLSSALVRGGIHVSLSQVLALIIYWLVMLAVVMVTFNILDLTVAAELFGKVVSFLPNVIAALFILILGIFIASFLAVAVRTAASNAGIAQSSLLAQLTQAVFVIFSAVAALQQLQIQFVGTAFLIVLSGVSLALALAFGLGCKDLAREWTLNFLKHLYTKKER